MRREVLRRLGNEVVRDRYDAVDRLFLPLPVVRLLALPEPLPVDAANCLLKNFRQWLMKSFWLLQCFRSCCGVQEPLVMHQSMKHCHMFSWHGLKFAEVVFFASHGQ